MYPHANEQRLNLVHRPLFSIQDVLKQRMAQEATRGNTWEMAQYLLLAKRLGEASSHSIVIKDDIPGVDRACDLEPEDGNVFIRIEPYIMRSRTLVPSGDEITSVALAALRLAEMTPDGRVILSYAYVTNRGVVLHYHEESENTDERRERFVCFEYTERVEE